MSATKYMRNDSHTVNTITGDVLGDSDTSGTADTLGRDDDGGTITFDFDVDIIDSGGGVTNLGSGVAQTNRAQGNTYGHQEATWNCPETSINSTDAIRLTLNIGASGTYVGTRVFISDQLGWTKLEAATWTFKRYTAVYDLYGFQGGMMYWGGEAGSPAQDCTDCKITGIEYSIYLDKGLRVKAGSGIISLGVETLNAHRLRYKGSDAIYGVPLITPGGANDSGVRIYDGSNVKTVPKL